MKRWLLGVGLLLANLANAHAGIVISGYMANPGGTDGNNEYVQLVATRDIDFAATNFSVVFANNNSATGLGWTASGALTYGFNLTGGSVTTGQTFYVGGTGQVLNGTTNTTSLSSLAWIRTIATATINGDGLGNFNSSGVMGNGGGNADGIAVFTGLTSGITDTTTPIDAVFYGTALGTAVVGGGTDGYVLPSNDLYAGGFLGSAGNTALLADPGNGSFNKLTGTFDTVLGTWTTARTLTSVNGPTNLGDISSGITISAGPEPSSIALLSLVGIGGFALRRLRKGRTGS